mmetsp:Transcript_24220/g.36830  ORF Transcript_24220/g.36830 Transcript_24220/m.36830 type:complete len:455 (-) Transcript_24220:111-1475(-)
MNLSRAFLFSQLCAATSSSVSLRGGNQERELNTRIIGGDAAAEDQYSYAVSLQDSFGHFCGGSLIAPDIVLSAAHCQRYETGYKAVIGRHVLDTTDGDEVNVKTEITYPGFDWGTTDNDYMILVLDRPVVEAMDNLVQVTPDVVPVGTAVTVMGWGDTHPSDEIQTKSDELMETEVFVVSNEECDKSNGTVGGTEADPMLGAYKKDYHNQISENMMCATDNGEDSCQGDSGGPLVIRSDSGDIQVGIVSWGVSCAHKDFPGVYARVSAKYEWIRKNVCEGSSIPPASFNCDSDDTTPQDVSHTGGWTTIIEEDFTTGLGLFRNHGNSATRYNRAKNRGGVVRIGGAEGGSSEIESNRISLSNNSFAKLRIIFSFYAIEMEHSDDLCVNYEIDNGVITGEKCWSSLHAFDNSRWYDDKSLELTVSNAQSLSIRFRVDGDDAKDDVLIDSVTVQGL